MPVKRRHLVRAYTARYKPYFEYDRRPPKPTAEQRFFYNSDGNEQPLFNPGHNYSQCTYPPSRLRSLRFEDCKWLNFVRPSYYVGVWLLTSAPELMRLQSTFDRLSEKKAKQFLKTYGKPILHACLGICCWQELGLIGGFYCHEEACDHSLDEWLTGTEGWNERLEIRITPGMDFGLHSKQEWEEGDILGAYLGEFISRRTGNTGYCHEVLIGPEFPKAGTKFAYIDAEHCGNYTRFWNRSCENNENAVETTVGKYRVLVLKVEESIADCAQITIGYSTDYFMSRTCLCGSARHKYPSDALQHSFEEVNQMETDRATRFDSCVGRERQVGYGMRVAFARPATNW